MGAHKPALRLDGVDHRAALSACRRWHYSRSMPAGKTVKVGVWEDGRYIGVVIFSRGATPNIGSPYQLKQTEICELTRVALSRHVTPVSRVIAIAVRFLTAASSGLRMIVSFADPDQGHHGGIYQAGNWIYTGRQETHAFRVHGETVHPKTLHSKFGVGGQSIEWLRQHIDPNAERVPGFKHRYLLPLDREIRERVVAMQRPYPKRAKDHDPADPAGVGGETPTRTLQSAATARS